MNKYNSNSVAFAILVMLMCACASSGNLKRRAYAYGWYPKNFKSIQKNYKNYLHFSNCQPGETIASIGAGNGTSEVAISCFRDSIDWYLQEIDSARLYQFNDVYNHFMTLRGSKIDDNFNLVIGTESSTNLPSNHFDRILMNNVYHELSDRETILNDVLALLKDDGQVVIMEPMARKQGEKHANCKHLRLYEPDFLREMEQFGFSLYHKEVVEKVSFLAYFTFKVRK